MECTRSASGVPTVGRLASWEAGIGITVMHAIDPAVFFLIPVSFAVVFMVWVLWNLCKDSNRR